MANNVVISQSVGASAVDTSVIPYMRAREVEFKCDNLRPGRKAQFFFGDVNVTRFVQRASKILPDNANTSKVSGIIAGERFYCNTTHGFASVIGTSMSNTIYLNENYITVNVSAIGANTLGASDYAPGDIVYQIPQVNGSLSNPTFEAKVFYWNNADGVLALAPITGTLNINASINTTATLYKSGADKTVRASSLVQGNAFPVNAIVSSLDNVANKFLVNTYESRHGIVASTVAPNANCVIVTGPVPSDAVGNIVYIAAQTGLGQAGLILSVSGNALYTNTTFSPYPTGNSYYSIGQNIVDDSGHMFGVFNIPETATVKFLTGTQTFTVSDSTIVDDPDASMIATGQYVAQGFLGSSSQTSPTTPVVQPTQTPPPAAAPISPSSPASSGSVSNPSIATASAGPNTTYAGLASQYYANGNSSGVIVSPSGTFSVNPIAQTFFTPPPKSAKANYGIFVSSIDLWFKNRPSGSSPPFPVQVKIVQTENGFPTTKIVSTATVQYADVKVSDTPDSVNVGSLFGNNQTATKFRFKDPVYLSPSTEYAIVVYSESPDYEVYISELGQVDVTSGNNNRRISEQPSVGSFFRSQNSSTWTPYQNQDLMFVINKAVFDTAPVSFTFNMDPINELVPYDELLLHASDLTFPQCQLTYKVLTTLANTFAQEASYQQIVLDKPWGFGQDLKVSSLNSTRRRVIIPGNNQSLLVQVSMQTNDPDISPIFNSEVLTSTITQNVINGGQVNQETITVTNGGNHINASNIVVTISAPDLADGTQATANVMVLQGNAVPFVTVTNPGSGYSIAPTITITEPGAPANATAVVAGENGKIGGNAIARYVTRKITLANGFDSGDLRVYLEAIRPTGTDVVVYYKVLSATDTQNFVDLPWVKMNLVNDINSPDQLTPIDLQFSPNLGPNGLPSGHLSYTVGNITYPLNGTFKHFALKIVLLADDTTVIPIVNSLQAIALPSG